LGRSYAGILGPGAFAAVLVRGVMRGGGIEGTLLSAWICLWAFAAVGYVAGRMAEWIVEESATARIAEEAQSET
jgi:hypothetical protein